MRKAPKSFLRCLQAKNFDENVLILNCLTVNLGPALGSALYVAGGFTLPYLVVASMAFIMAIVLAVVVPNVTVNEKVDGDPETKSVTFSALIKVKNLVV